eukprot:g5025.t1
MVDVTNNFLCTLRPFVKPTNRVRVIELDTGVCERLALNLLPPGTIFCDKYGAKPVAEKDMDMVMHRKVRYGNKHYVENTRKKVLRQLQVLEAAPDGQWVMFVDVDVTYFANPFDWIKRLKPTASLMFQSARLSYKACARPNEPAHPWTFTANIEERDDPDGPDWEAVCTGLCRTTHEDGTKKSSQAQARLDLRKTNWHSKSLLCPYVAQDKECPHGTRCKRFHDVEKFLRESPPDLCGVSAFASCPLHERTGRCPAGFACRFASSHIVRGAAPGDGTAPPRPRLLKTTDAGADADDSAARGLNHFTGADLKRVRRRRRARLDGSDGGGRLAEALRLTELRLKCRDCLLSLPTSAFSRRQLEIGESGKSFRGKRRRAVEPVADGAAPARRCIECVRKLKVRECKAATCRVCGMAFTSRTQLFLHIEAEGHDGSSGEEEEGVVYVAPLTTLGHLPFRRVCKGFGADVTCAEMALASSLLDGKGSEWALLRRHPSETLFGIQLAGSDAPSLAATCDLLHAEAAAGHASFDFVDLNLGCPIDALCARGAGCGLCWRPELERVVRSASMVLGAPLSIKLEEQETQEGAEAEADDEAKGTGADTSGAARGPALLTAMIGRGALIKPWLCTEIKERRDWDISSSERFDMLRDFVRFGLEHWGSDAHGVGVTRRYLLEWLSFLCRYVPAGLLERLPQRMNQKPPAYAGRDELETLMASSRCADWVRISEMLLGPVEEGFRFEPKHKSSSY